jgi:hypothetical protein
VALRHFTQTGVRLMGLGWMLLGLLMIVMTLLTVWELDATMPQVVYPTYPPDEDSAYGVAGRTHVMQLGFPGALVMVGGLQLLLSGWLARWLVSGLTEAGAVEGAPRARVTVVIRWAGLWVAGAGAAGGISSMSSRAMDVHLDGSYYVIGHTGGGIYGLAQGVVLLALGTAIIFGSGWLAGWVGAEPEKGS